MKIMSTWAGEMAKQSEHLLLFQRTWVCPLLTSLGCYTHMYTNHRNTRKRVLNAKKSSKFSRDDFGGPPWPPPISYSIILNSAMTFCSSVHMRLLQETSQSEL